jgi:hypothetical protein
MNIFKSIQESMQFLKSPVEPGSLMTPEEDKRISNMITLPIFFLLFTLFTGSMILNKGEYKPKSIIQNHPTEISTSKNNPAKVISDLRNNLQ